MTISLWGLQTNVCVQRVAGLMTLLHASAESETRTLTRIGIVVVCGRRYRDDVVPCRQIRSGANH